MGNKPSEYNGVNCSDCGRRLPPCKSFDGFVLQTIDRKVRVDQVYVFLGGQYYRIMGLPSYYCPTCFWRPKNDYVREQEERRRREEAERRRREQEEREREAARQREIARQEEEERLRREEQQRQEEERRREQEAREEAARQEALLEEQERYRQTLEEAAEREAQAEQNVQSATYKPFLAVERSRLEVQEAQGVYNTNIPDEAAYLENEAIEEIDIVTKELVDSVQFSIIEIDDDDELNGFWLKAAQTLLLTYYMQSNSFSMAEKDFLLDLLAFLQTDLGDVDCYILADSFSYLVDIRPADMSTTFMLEDTLPLNAKVSSLLIKSAKHLKKTNLWMQRCLYTYIGAASIDEQMQKMYLEVYCKDWSGYNWLRLFEKCSAQLSDDNHKQVVHLIQTFFVKPSIVMDELEKNPQNVLTTVKTTIDNEENQLLVDIFHQIRETKLVEEDVLRHVEKLAERVYEILGTFNIKLDYSERFQSTLTKSKTTFQRLANSTTSVTDEDIAQSMITLMCACLKVKPFYPRRTQMVSLLLLLLSSRQETNLLLEVMTGEGKSLVVVLFATILAVQGKHVDVVTSSPILAVRDVEEYAAFYQLFHLTVTHNTDLNRAEDADMDEVRKDCYKQHVVYGTVGNFAGDILRQEFEQKRIRESRRFDAIIVDEVDMLMLDEGVQFTYLSHNAAILQHMEPVISAVWGLIGPINMATTISGQILYVNNPKLFTQAIYESLDPELSQVESHSQVLATAMQLGIITESQFENLLSDEQEVKKPAIAALTIQNALSLITGLEDYDNMPEFKAYTVNSEGILQAATSVIDELSAEKFLLLGNGLACVLNTQEEIIERGTEILKTKLNFSATENDAAINLPKQMEDYVLNQLPLFIENALRALHMEEDREYAITKGKLVPVDFQNSGVMELNKRWGGGLQQMLELKHNLSLTPTSLVTNFMSNVEFFSRYKRDGGIYGMSGTLGLDSHSNTTMLLKELYNTTVCSIPTFKLRKLFEKPAIIVDNNEQWFKQIVSTVEEESKEVASWKKGRAVLILCEDIKTAEDLKKYVIETENWDESKVYLYAHSNSKQLSTIKKKLGPGEVIIATNLAGRGTNVKVTDDVNASGGLLCLVTFLARNRRVELQAFGRTARGGKTGSVRCVLNYSLMPAQYNGMNIEQIRKLRAEEESLRLHQLINNDVKEVQARETLFRAYCSFLQGVHQRVQSRDDKRVIITSLNEKWGQWLDMKTEAVERLETEQLLAELQQTTASWNPTLPSSSSQPVTLSVANFYHYVSFGNQLLIEDTDEEIRRAYSYFSKSIEMDSRFAAIAYYNRAYAAITAEMDDNKQKAKEDIQKALESLNLYIVEVSIVAQCAALVQQTRKFQQREEDDYGEEGEEADNLDAQIQARFEILRFLREKMEEAIQKIDEIDGDIIAEPTGIFSLMPEADYTTNIELARMWTLGLEIVYTIEEKPRFCWEGLVIFLLGVVQIVGGVLLTVFTAGAAAQFGLALIGEGISDCIDGIEGMVTGEFSWTEWAITKATGIAISLISSGVSRLASSGLKGIKAGYKIAKAGRQLKAIPRIIRNTTGAAAKRNLKIAAKYVAKEAVLQGVSYAQAKFVNMALDEVARLIGEKLKQGFMEKIREAFLNGYLGEVVDGRFIAELNESYSTQSEVPQSMQRRGKQIFSNVGDAVISDLSTDSEVKERLTTSSLSLFSEISQKSEKLKGFANLAEAAIVITLVTDAAASLGFLVDDFPPKMEEVCRTFIADQKIVMSTRSATPYRNYSCVIKFKNDLADHVGTIFANAIAVLLQGKLRPLVNQYQMTNKIGRLTNKVVGKYILKTDKTMQDIKSIQHANYIRSVGFDTSGSGPVSDITVAKLYAKEIASSDSPGSLMEMRVAADHFGQKVTIYTEINGKLVKDSSVDPTTKKTQDEVKLVYIPPPDTTSVGHYDVMVGGARRRVQADQSNCLFHAYAYSRNPNLTRDQLKREAATLRETVATTISNEPSRFAEHIRLRVQINNLRRGKRFAMIGAGPPDPDTKVIDKFYQQKAVGDKVYTMYEQVNGVKCKAVRKYNKNLTVDSKNVVQEADARLETFEVSMEGLNLQKAAGKRCWDTKPVVGMIKRPKGDPKDTEVSYHCCPSRGGANAGDQYANAIPASPHYNNLEKYIWSKSMQTALGNHDFSMTVQGYCGPLDQAYNGKRDIDAATKALLDKRYAEIQKKEPRAYRLEDPTTFTVNMPATVTKKELDDIAEATNSKESLIGVDTDLTAKTVKFYMPQDYELFTPTDLTTLQPNGEQYAGEITNAKMKQKKLTVGKAPYYRSSPKGTKTAADKVAFDTDFANFAV